MACVNNAPLAPHQPFRNPRCSLSFAQVLRRHRFNTPKRATNRWWSRLFGKVHQRMWLGQRVFCGAYKGLRSPLCLDPLLGNNRGLIRTFFKMEVNELSDCHSGPTKPQQAEPLGDKSMLPIGATTDTQPRLTSTKRSETLLAPLLVCLCDGGQVVCGLNVTFARIKYQRANNKLPASGMFSWRQWWWWRWWCVRLLSFFVFNSSDVTQCRARFPTQCCKPVRFSQH